METSAKGWKCQSCQRQNSNKADFFCPGCGKPWRPARQTASWYTYQAEDSKPPWKAETWRGPSPRRKSPRRRGSKGGQPPSGAKPQGKGKQADAQQEGPSVPSLALLPAKPAAVVPVAPKASPALQTSGPSPEKAQLDALLSSLAGSMENLPMETKQLLATLKKDKAQSEAKTLHKAVAAQAQAKKELATIQHARTAYLEAWHSYVVSVTEMLQANGHAGGLRRQGAPVVHGTQTGRRGTTTAVHRRRRSGRGDDRGSTGRHGPHPGRGRGSPEKSQRNAADGCTTGASSTAGHQEADGGAAGGLKEGKLAHAPSKSRRYRSRKQGWWRWCKGISASLACSVAPGQAPV